MDVAFLIIYALGIFVQLYRMTIGMLNASIYFPKRKHFMNVQSLDLVQYFSFLEQAQFDERNVSLFGANYMLHLFFGPKKLGLLMDLLYAFGFAVSGQWACVAYFAVPWLPAAFMEFFIYPWLPYLDTPLFPWDQWFAGIKETYWPQYNDYRVIY